MKTNRLSIEPGFLCVEPTGLNKLWSFRRKIRVPLSHVRGATFDPGIRDEPKGVRAPGLRMPGKLAGVFHQDGAKHFWNISGYENAVVITLDDSQTFSRLILSLDEPDQAANLINAAIA